MERKNKIVKSFFARFYQLQTEDFDKLSNLSLLYFTILTGATFGVNTVTAIFIKRQGVEFLPLMYILSSLLTFIIIPTYSVYIDRVNKVLLFNRMLLIITLIVLFSRTILNLWLPYSYSFLYIFANLSMLVLYTGFWTLANDLCDLRQAKRIFPLIIGSGLVGGLCAGFFGGYLVNFLHTENLLFFWAGFLALALLFTRKMYRFDLSVHSTTTVTSTFFSPLRLLLTDSKEIFKVIRNSKYLLAISLVFIVYALTVYIMDFQFNRAVNVHIRQEDKLTAFYGYYSGWFYLSTFIMQLFVVNRFLSHWGVGNAFLLFPATLFLGFTTLCLRYSFVPAVGAKFTRDVVGNSIIETAYPLLFNPVPQNLRGRIIAFMEGLVIPLGICIAGLGLFFSRQIHPMYLNVFGIIITVLWFLLCLWLRREYVGTLTDSLRSGSFDVQYLSIKAITGMRDKQVIPVLIKALNDPEVEVNIFAVEMLKQLKLPMAIECLLYAAETHLSPRVRATIAQSLGNINEPRTGKVLIRLADDSDDRVRANAVESLAKITGPKNKDLFLRKLADVHLRVRLNAAIGLANLNEPTGLNVLMDMLRNDNQRIRTSVAYAAGRILPVRGGMEILTRSLADPSSRVRLNAVRGITVLSDEQVFALLVKRLNDPHRLVRNLTREKLINLAPEKAFPVLAETVNSKENIRIRLNAVEGIAQLRDKRSRNYLAKLLTDENELMREKTAIALEKVDTDDLRQACLVCLSKETELVYFNLIRKDSLRKNTAIPTAELDLLVQAIAEKDKRLRRQLIRLIGLLEGIPSAGMTFNWKESDLHRRAYFLELVDESISKKIAAYTVPLLEDEEETRLLDRGYDLLNRNRLEFKDCILTLAKDQDEWIRACTVYTIDRLSLTDYIEVVIDLLDDESRLVSDNAAAAIRNLEMKVPDTIKKIHWVDVLRNRN